MIHTVGEIRMKTYTFGTGKRHFLILPGLSPTSTADLGPAVEKMYAPYLDRYTYTLFDRRENVPATYSHEDMADDTYRVMLALGIREADVYGVSQGGVIARKLAERHPEAVRKLVLASTSNRTPPATAALFTEWANLAKARDEHGLIESFLTHVYSPKTVAVIGESFRRAGLHCTESDYDRFAVLATALVRGPSPEDVSGVGCPVFVIGSAGDRVFGGDSSPLLAADLGCECFLYPSEYGHAVYDEAPGFLDRVFAFLLK